MVPQARGTIRGRLGNCLAQPERPSRYRKKRTDTGVRLPCAHTQCAHAEPLRMGWCSRKHKQETSKGAKCICAPAHAYLGTIVRRAQDDARLSPARAVRGACERPRPLRRGRHFRAGAPGQATRGEGFARGRRQQGDEQDDQDDHM